MKGALLVSYESLDSFGGDYIEITNNNSIVKRIYSSSSRLYSIPIISGDVVSVEFKNVGSVDVDLKRYDFTLDDENGDKGKKETSISPTRVGKKYTFTATTINGSYDFQYVFDSSATSTCMNNGTGFTSYARVVAIQSDDKILVAGTLTQYSGQSITGLTRLNQNGAIDSTYTPNTQSLTAPFAIFVNDDDSFILGDFSGPRRVCKYNSNGTVDNTFNRPVSQSNQGVLGIGRQSDGKYIFVGQFTDYDNTNKNFRNIVRVDSNGIVDTTFQVITGSSSIQSQVNDIIVLPDDKFIVSGQFTNYSGITNYARGVLKFNSNGTVDTSFTVGTGFVSLPVHMDIQSTGKLVFVAGTSYNGNAFNSVCRLNSNGTFDSTFTGPFTGATTTRYIKVLPDDKILLCGALGNYTGWDGTGSKILLRLNPDGSIDNTFNTVNGGSVFIDYLETDSVGNIYVCGDFTFTGVTPNVRDFLKFDSNGNLISNNC